MFRSLNHCFAQMCLLIGTVSQVSDVAHGPIVLDFWNQTHLLLS